MVTDKETTVLNSSEVAKLLRIHRNTLMNWIKSGSIPAPKRYGKRYIFTQAYVDQLLAFKELQSKGDNDNG